MTAAIAVCRNEWRAVLRAPMRVLALVAIPVSFLIFAGIALDTTARVSYASDGVVYQRWMLAGVMVAQMILCAASAAVTMIEQRDSGFLQIMLLCAERPWQILIGKLMAVWLECLTLSCFALLFSPLLDVHLGAYEIALCVLASMLASLLVVAIVFLIAISSEVLSAFVVRAQVLGWLSLMLGGMLFPVTSLDGLWRDLADINPVTYAIDALRGILLSGEVFVQVGAMWPVADDLGVVLGVAVLTSWAALRCFPKWAGVA